MTKRRNFRRAVGVARRRLIVPALSHDRGTAPIASCTALVAMGAGGSESHRDASALRFVVPTRMSVSRARVSAT